MDDDESLQDPHNPDQRDLKKFKHLDANLKPIVDESNDGSVNNINVSATGGAGEPCHLYPMRSDDDSPKEVSSGAILKSIAKSKEKEKAETSEDVEKALPPPAASSSQAPASTSNAAAASSSANTPWNTSKYSTNHLAASLTSTSAPVQTKTERALFDEEVLMFEAIVRLSLPPTYSHTLVHADKGAP